jgi:hypothetical protein
MNATLNRAFELADRGCNLFQIRQALLREGFDQDQVSGAEIVAELSSRIRAARERKPKRSPSALRSIR